MNISTTGRPNFMQVDGGYMNPQHPLSDPIAQKTIPRGFTATHVDVYGANNEDFDVYKGEIDNDTTPQVEGGSCVMNTQCTLTLPVSKFLPTPVPSNFAPLTSILFDDHSGSRVRKLSPVFLCKDIS